MMWLLVYFHTSMTSYLCCLLVIGTACCIGRFKNKFQQHVDHVVSYKCYVIVTALLQGLAFLQLFVRKWTPKLRWIHERTHVQTMKNMRTHKPQATTNLVTAPKCEVLCRRELSRSGNWRSRQHQLGRYSGINTTPAWQILWHKHWCYSTWNGV